MAQTFEVVVRFIYNNVDNLEEDEVEDDIQTYLEEEYTGVSIEQLEEE